MVAELEVVGVPGGHVPGHDGAAWSHPEGIWGKVEEGGG